jgi:O-antigen chain-terminating methyltransferase
MLESKNPEIDPGELMARAQAETQRLKTAKPSPAPDPPAGLVVSPPDQLRDEIADAIAQARQSNQVRAGIPRFLHPLFRNQGRCIRLLMRAVELQEKQIEILHAIVARLQETNLQNLRAEIASQKEMLARLLNQLDPKRAESSNATLAAAATEVRRHELDAFYTAFENRHRGTRSQIKDRLRVYLPHVARAGAGTPERPILDLGCGRGEWLELMKENGHAARGADLNIPMLSLCRELGLDVVESDALACLRSLPDRSLGMVTGFHIIEHLPFPVLLELMKQIHRVLQDGGLAVLETPNPGNIVVGACNFYIDPTHRSPLPSALTEFLFEYAGFTDIRVLLLQLCDARQRVPEAESPLARRFNDYFYGPLDYGVIGIKPAPPHV